jgi:hypothetical protein
MVILVDGTLSMSDLFATLKTLLPQIFSDTYKTL